MPYRAWITMIFRIHEIFRYHLPLKYGAPVSLEIFFRFAPFRMKTKIGVAPLMVRRFRLKFLSILSKTVIVYIFPVLNKNEIEQRT